MPRHVLIAGSASLLASHVAALRLASSEDAVSVLLCRPEGAAFTPEEAVALVRHAARSAPGTGAEAGWESRLRALPGFEALSSLSRVDEVWWLTGGVRGASAGPRQLLSLLPALGVTELNFVGPALEPGAEAEHEVEAKCGASGVVYRLFRTGLVIAEPPALSGPDREGGLQLLEAVHDLRAELEERLPGYFKTHPLRCWAPAGARLNLAPAEQVAASMLRIAAPSSGHAAGRYDVRAPEPMAFQELCELVGKVQGLSLQVTSDRQALNAIDRALDERLGGFHAWLSPPGGPAPEAGPASEALRLDRGALVPLLQRIFQRHQEARAASRTRAAGLLGTLASRTLERAGSTLSYRVGGSGGTAVVVLNALGQGLHYWSRLMDLLVPNHRVVLWEPRGTDVGPHPFKLRDQVDDLEALLEKEGIQRCHLVGWCTGPKVAVEFYLRRPAAVASMVFLNGTFKCVGSPKELDTAYERNFESLCGILDRRPAMAASILKSLQLSMGGADGSDLLGEPDSEELAASVLALMNRDLRTHVLAPLRNESVVVNYARQLIDFWSYDTRKSAGQVRVPVLLISAEHDGVASPEMSQMMAKLLPDARHVHVQGATHYCLYDRPGFIAGHLEAFFQASGGGAAPLHGLPNGNA
jgi:pimeloyl-ACP methyl ester carboxylesterase